MKKVIFVVIALALWIIACKTKPAPAALVSTIDPVQMQRMWKSVDSLEQKGLLTSALTEVRKIKKLALEGNDSQHLVKAIVLENKYLIQLEEDSAIKALERLESEIGTYPEPARSVMHSLAGQWYGQYLQTHLWELRNRTEYSGTPGADIRTWGIRHFIDRIHHHFYTSVRWEGLKSATVDDYDMLLTDKQNTDDLRPTLYDILMHRAIDFYSGTESYLTKPVYEFVLTDPHAFAPARAFITNTFTTNDTLSNTWQTLQLFKELLQFRLSDDSHEAALVDADLKRLRYVYDNINIESKDSLYESALTILARDHAGSPESTLVDYYRATLLTQQADTWVQDTTSPHRYSYNKALEICRNAISKFPNSYGSQLCQNLITQIETKTISAVAESVSLPGEELLAQIQYRNISDIHFKLLKLPEAPRRWRGENWNGEEVLQRLSQMSSIRSWHQSIDDGDDHQPHTTEIPIPSLTLGHYALVISDLNDFDVKKSTTGAIMFTVSELGYWYLDDRATSHTAAIVNRRTGLPIQGVKTEFITYSYTAGRQRPVETKIGEGISDPNGWVSLPVKENQNITLRLTKGEDELFEEEGYHTYRYGRDSGNDPTTLFFSDRAIYRPGQKIFFKGYALNFDSHRVPGIVAKKNIEVILYDANGQEQSKQNFVTNDYGTFAGHFDIPSGGLTGQMSISSSHGASRHYFQVEEYKRPKFEITYDTLRETVKLNDEVTIEGYAKDFAGSPVSDADVSYRVERVSFRPWWYGYYRKSFFPEEDRQVLATGTTNTGSDGSFDITFIAKPKAGGSPDLMYRFETTVFVTDLTGESHELVKSITLNRQGYEVNISLPGKISLQNLKEIGITATNSDGARVIVNGELEAYLLEGPTRNKRNRLWESPDILTISENEYSSRFPNYFIPGKEEMPDWKINRSVGTKKIMVNGSDSIDVSNLFTQAGYYKLSWSWQDANKKELEITQYVMVYDENRILPGNETVEVNFRDKNYAPGETVEVDLLTGLSTPPKTLRLIERRVNSTTREWLSIPTYNDKSILVTESDRGGIYLHHLTVFNNRFIQSQQLIQVPWINKDLHVELKTWRDKMEPGDEESWTVSVKGDKQEAVTAEMLLSMYDASLDAFVPHRWDMNLYPSTMNRLQILGSITKPVHYWGLTYHLQEMMKDIPYRQYRDIDVYGYYPEGMYHHRRYKGERDMAADGVMLEAQSAAPPSAIAETGKASGNDVQEESETPPHPQVSVVPPPLRAVLDETVFFYPQLKTDDKGNLTFTFRMKEGLTRWKFQALAHTKDLAFGLAQAEAVTQKQLMIFPNPPRFFREGDTIAFQAKTSNLTNQGLSGSAQLKIIDVITNMDVTDKWNLPSATKDIKIAANGSTPLSWMVVVPRKWLTPVKYQVSITAGAFTDGEESIVPVVTNRILVTETLPLPVKAKETKTFVFKSMQNRSSGTHDPYRYVVEMTTSPAWYAVQALPYLMEYPHEGAEHVFSRLYANTLASHIAMKNPGIKQVYDAWRSTNDDALLSNLEKNQDLKSAILEETPWVRDAMDETKQKKDIALLFETNKLRNESQQALRSLRQQQLPNGAFSWFPGGRDNWYITQYIVEGFGHLRKMGVNIHGDENDIIQNAVPYLDGEMMQWYDDLKRLADQGKLKMEDHHVSSLQIHYLYVRSFYPDIKHVAKMDEVINYVKTQSEKYWLEHGIYDQGLMALAFYRSFPKSSLSREILASLRERTIVHEELGRYWKINPGFHWYEAPVELQSLMVELFQEMKVPQAEVDELRVWLLKQKQTTRWKSTKATASAIYALLIHPDAWLSSTGVVEVSLGNTEVIGSSSSTEPGTGYIKRSWDGDEIKSNWSEIRVENPNNHIAWGSAYYQYWEDIDKVPGTVDANPLKITRSLLKTRSTDRGEVTNEAEIRNLKVGDKLLVRLIVESDRAMEFVHLKDVRASGFEPMDVISGYRWTSSLGYYQSTRDLATHFFIDYLPRGKFVIEYPVTVAQAGSYSEGLATLQSMYAPEFGDHSEGQRVMAGSK